MGAKRRGVNTYLVDESVLQKQKARKVRDRMSLTPKAVDEYLDNSPRRFHREARPEEDVVPPRLSAPGEAVYASTNPNAEKPSYQASKALRLLEQAKASAAEGGKNKAVRVQKQPRPGSITSATTNGPGAAPAGKFVPVAKPGLDQTPVVEDPELDGLEYQQLGNERWQQHTLTYEEQRRTLAFPSYYA